VEPVQPTAKGCQARRTIDGGGSSIKIEVKCTDGRKATGDALISTAVQDDLDRVWPLNHWGDHMGQDVSWLSCDSWYGPYEDLQTWETPGPWKTITKTQAVKISNSGTMTLYEYKKVKNKMKLSKVKSIVGGTGKVVDRWSWGKDDYLI